MPKPADLFHRIGAAPGCHALATAFYAHVAQDPILRPLFPSTFRCAIEEFSAFLVQFFGGDPAATQKRWWLSLSESHRRFAIGPRERAAWLKAMESTLAGNGLLPDPESRRQLLDFFRHSSAHVVNRQPAAPAAALEGELAPLWREQLALDEAVSLVRLAGTSPSVAARCLDLAAAEVLKSRFARSPSVHASFLALAAASGSSQLWQYAAAELRANPSLGYQQFSFERTLLHAAAATGDVPLIELLLSLGPRQAADAERALYCLGNECSVPGGGRIVRLLIDRTPARINAAHGAKSCTALHMAARRGNTEIIAALLDAGAAIEVRDTLFETPLRRAVNCNQVEAARLLLVRGADPHSRGSKGLTPARAARSAPMKRLFESITGPA